MNFVNNRLNQPMHMNPRNTELICRYCKNPGHTLEQCRKRQYNNSRNQNNQFPVRNNRTGQNSGNQDRAQRVGAALNERPQVRLVTPEESRTETQV